MQDNVTQAVDGECFLSEQEAVRLAGLIWGDEAYWPTGWSLAVARIHGDRLASTAQPEVKALVEALETAISLLWEHCEGIAPRIEPLERTLAAHHEAQP